MTDTYTLPDGSPRFGVRTAEPVTRASEPEPAHPAADAVAWQADELDAVEMETALQYRYRLGSRKADEALIAGLRSAHPEELRAAEATVSRVLTSPKTWHSEAMHDRRTRLAADFRAHGGAAPAYAAPMMGKLVLGLLPLLIWAVASAAHVPDLAAFGILFAASAGLAPYRRRLDRKVRGMLPPTIHAEDRDMLWDDAVDATLADILEHKPGVDPAALTAARRAWRHNMSAAANARKLAYG